MILHNFLIQEKLNSDEDLYYNPENAGDNDNVLVLAPDEELNEPIAANDAAGKRQEQLRAYLSEKGII